MTVDFCTTAPHVKSNGTSFCILRPKIEYYTGPIFLKTDQCLMGDAVTIHQLFTPPLPHLLNITIILGQQVKLVRNDHNENNGCSKLSSATLFIFYQRAEQGRDAINDCESETLNRLQEYQVKLCVARQDHFDKLVLTQIHTPSYNHDQACQTCSPHLTTHTPICL